MKNIGSQNATAFDELRNLSELMESDDQFANALTTTPLFALPERLENEGFNANLLLELLRSDLLDLFNHNSSGKSLGLTAVLGMSISTLIQDYPDLASELLHLIDSFAVRADDSLLSVAGGTSQFQNWKDHPLKTWKPDSNRSTKEKAEAIGIDVVETAAPGLIGYAIYKAVRKKSTAPEPRQVDDLAPRFESAKQNTALNRSKIAAVNEFSALPRKHKRGDLERLEPEAKETALGIRQNRIKKVRDDWSEHFAGIKSTSKIDTIDFNESVRVRELKKTVSIGEGKVTLGVKISDLPERQLRPPSGDISKQRYGSLSPRDRNAAEQFSSFDTGWTKSAKPYAFKRYNHFLRIEYKTDLRDANIRRESVPNRGILKQPTPVSNSNWERLHAAYQNTDIDNLSLRRIGRESSSLAVSFNQSEEPTSSHQLLQPVKDSDLNNSLLENRPDFQRDLIQHESILLENISGEASNIKQDSSQIVDNVEQEAKNAVGKEITSVDAEIDAIADDA